MLFSAIWPLQYILQECKYPLFFLLRNTHLGARPRVPGRVREISYFELSGVVQPSEWMRLQILDFVQSSITSNATKEKMGESFVCSINNNTYNFDNFWNIYFDRPTRAIVSPILSFVFVLNFVGQQFRNETEAKEFWRAKLSQRQTSNKKFRFVAFCEGESLKKRAAMAPFTHKSW